MIDRDNRTYMLLPNLSV